MLISFINFWFCGQSSPTVRCLACLLSYIIRLFIRVIIWANSIAEKNFFFVSHLTNFLPCIFGWELVAKSSQKSTVFFTGLWQLQVSNYHHRFIKNCYLIELNFLEGNSRSDFVLYFSNISTNWRLVLVLVVHSFPLLIVCFEIRQLKFHSFAHRHIWYWYWMLFRYFVLSSWLGTGFVEAVMSSKHEG